MGLFSKIKDNLTGGGVKIELAAPDIISLSDAEIPVQISITNGDSERRVNQVKLQLIEVAEEAALGYSDEDGSSTEEKSLLETQLDDAFALSPNENKVLELSLRPVKRVPVAESTLTDKAKGALSKVSKVLDVSEYTYYLKAEVDVDGIAIDPSATKTVTLSTAE